jgi:peptidoglycan/xylan/chitin deacetylase (PgdA/CDA1 family)
LYVQARFEDIKTAATPGGDHDFTTQMLITNTKFTEQAEIYAACIGLTLLSWDYPERGNLRELIEETGVHPLPCVTTLSGAQKRRLMEQGIVLTRQLYEHIPLLKSLGLSDRTLDSLFDEVEHLSASPFSDTMEV